MAIEYNSGSGQYRNLTTKRFVGRLEVMRYVDQEAQRTQTRLQAQMRLLIESKIDLPEWERRMAQTLKDSHIRMATLGAGGKPGLTQRHYGAIGYQLREQYRYLDGFAQDLAAGKLTPKQALYRSGLYANSIKLAFHKSEQITKASEAFRSAKRLLDPQAHHCSSCLGYAALGWQPIEEAVSPGVSCECGQFCKCTIIYSKFAVRVLRAN